MKKSLLIFALLGFCFSFVNGQNKTNIEVKNIKPVQDTLYVGPYDSKSNYTVKSYKSARALVDTSSITDK